MGSNQIPDRNVANRNYEDSSDSRLAYACTFLDVPVTYPRVTPLPSYPLHPT